MVRVGYMRTKVRVALTLSAVTVAAGLTAWPAQAAGTTYYVDISNQACSDSGSGTAAAPFCSIQAGVNAASAGDTVIVSSSLNRTYQAGTVISKSGSDGSPITIVSNPAQHYQSNGNPLIWMTSGSSAFTLNGASHIVIRGFAILNYASAPLVQVQNSTDVTLDGIDGAGSANDGGSAAVTVDGASSAVTISRSMLSGVTVSSGAANVTVTTNRLFGNFGQTPILATGVNGLSVTSNTVQRACPSGIDVEGTSQQVSIENNIVIDDWGWGPGISGGYRDCAGVVSGTTPAKPEVTVSAGSAAQTTSDYNDLYTWPTNNTAMYSWNGATYPGLAAFTAATGQGTHDLASLPWPAQQQANPYPTADLPLTEGSPAIDSGDANAPGLLATDILGNGRTDDPYVPNAGTGSGYVDRGAYEFVPPAGSPATVTATPLTGTYPLVVTATATPPSAWAWASTYSFNFNDGTGWTTPSSSNKIQHTYEKLGANTAGIDVRETLYGATTSAHDSDTITVNPGSAPLVASLNLSYPSVPAAPISVTASGAGTTDGAPISSYSFDFGDGSAPVVVSAADGNSATHLMAVGTYTVKLTVVDALGNTATATQQLVVSTNAAEAAALTVTEGAPVNGLVPVTMDPKGTSDGAPITSYSFDFGDGSAPVVVNAATSAPVTRSLPLGLYPVKLTVSDALGRTQSVSKTVAVGGGFQPYGPARIMDTRKGIGVPAGAVPALGTVKLKLPQALLGTADSPTLAVVLNVTVTAPSSGGYLTVYPDGVTRPTSSNLDFNAGETVPNQVTVPVGAGGTVDFYLGSGASAQLIADVEGVYTLGSGTGYTGVGPTRVLDTRSGLGGAGGRVAGGGTLTLTVPTSVVPASATAVLMNVTVVHPSGGGYLTVYPDGGSRPTTSVLDFPANDTVPNLVVVPITNGKVDFYLGSAGSADLVADVAGYYSPSSTSVLLPFVPTRLLDTRKIGPLPAGTYGTLELSTALGVPSNLLSAALYNVTVTRPQTGGYLTVFPDGLPAMPKASNLDFAAGQTIANAVLSPLLDGGSNIYNGSGGNVDVIVDLFGVFAPTISQSPLGSSVTHLSGVAGQQSALHAPHGASSGTR